MDESVEAVKWVFRVLLVLFVIFVGWAFIGFFHDNKNKSANRYAQRAWEKEHR